MNHDSGQSRRYINGRPDLEEVYSRAVNLYNAVTQKALENEEESKWRVSGQLSAAGFQSGQASLASALLCRADVGSGGATAGVPSMGVGPAIKVSLTSGGDTEPSDSAVGVAVGGGGGSAVAVASGVAVGGGGS